MITDLESWALLGGQLTDPIISRNTTPRAGAFHSSRICISQKRKSSLGEVQQLVKDHLACKQGSQTRASLAYSTVHFLDLKRVCLQIISLSTVSKGFSVDTTWLSSDPQHISHTAPHSGGEPALVDTAQVGPGPGPRGLAASVTSALWSQLPQSWGAGLPRSHTVGPAMSHCLFPLPVCRQGQPQGNTFWKWGQAGVTDY